MHLCAGCRDDLMGDLRDVESTVEAIWASCARMDVGSGSVGTSGHACTAEPTNAKAYDTGRTLNVILTGWTHAIGNRQPNAVKAATVLLEQIREVREQDWAPVLQQELREALNDCRRAMDRSGPRIFAGICPGPDDMPDCGTPVYAPEGKVAARCQTCGTTWDVTEWRERAITALGPSTGTATEISRMLSDPARALMFPKNKIAVWASRGKLTHVNEWDRWMARIFDRPIPAKLYQVRKVRNLWERSLIESAVRSERMRLAKAERERAELEAARAERRERMAA